MKGVFLQQPLEFNLLVEGSQWYQGDLLNCELAVKNRGSAEVDLSDLYLNLSCGQTKKVKAKASDAFVVIAAAQFGKTDMLAGGEQISFPWTFELDQNCIVTENAQSLYLDCGKRSVEVSAGQLQVNVLPHQHIEAVHTLLENSFGFVLRGIKSKKNRVEAKFKPPLGKKFITVEGLTLSANFADNDLNLDYLFQVKKLAASASTFGIKKDTTVFEQKLEKSKYLFPGGLLNHQPLEDALAEVLKAVE